MSKEFICDNCGKKAGDSGLQSAKDWMKVNISGHVPRGEGRYGGHQSVSYDLCDECLDKVFPKDMEAKDLVAEFAVVASDLIQEMVQEAMENA